MQYIKTVLDVDATKAIAGFKKGEQAGADYASGLLKAGQQADKAKNSFAGIDKAVAGTTNTLNGLGSGGMKAPDAMFTRLTRSMRENRAEWDRIGSSATIGGTAILGALGLATREAIAWESAWAGVMKTVDASPAQFAELEQGLRDMTSVLPASHAEIAGVAEAAGQLGVASGDILAFTRTAIDLGEATNLTAEEAATGLARISNVMGTTAREGIEGVEKLGSTLVDLGNNSATTESEILQMAQRLAGAGATIGATEADVLALAAAMSSVGIEAQLGGGAMSRAMLQMNSAVLSGSEELDKFAETAGMSAEEFSTAWRQDPVAAVGEFVAGLDRITAQGGDATQVLDDVGLAGTQNAQVMLRAAGANDILTESLELSGEAWEANSALSKEAAQRYQTDAAQIAMAWNQIKDAAIDVGGDLAPIVTSIASGVGDLVSAFTELPGPVKSFATATATLVGGGLLIGGTAIKAVGFAQDLSGALGALSGNASLADRSVSRTNRTIRGMARWGGYALGVVAVAQGMEALAEAGAPAEASIEDVTEALLELDDAANTQAVDEMFRELGDGNLWARMTQATTDVDGMAEAFQRLTDPSIVDRSRNLTDQIRFWGDTDVENMAGTFERVGEALAGMDPDVAAARFEVMVDSLGGGEEVAKRLLELMPAYSDSLTDSANAAKQAAEGGGEFTEELDEQGRTAEEAVEAIDALRTALDMLGGGFRAERASVREYSEAVDEAVATLKDSESTYDEQEATLDAVAQAAIDVASAQLEMGRSHDVIAADIGKARKQFVDLAMDMGMTEEAANDLADAQGLIESDIVAMFEAAGAGEATARVLEFDESIQLLNDKTVEVGEKGAQEAKGNVLELDGAIFGLEGTTVEVTEIGSTLAGDRVVRFGEKIYALDDRTVRVEEEGSIESERRVGSLEDKIWGIDDRIIDVTVRTSGYASLASLQRAVDSMSGRTLTVAMGTYKAQALGGIEYHGPTPMESGALIGGGRQLAAGTLSPGIYPTSSAGIWMAEDTSAPWELYASGRPDLAPRSRSIIEQGAKMLGGRIDWARPMEQGGVSVHAARHYTPAPVAPSSSGGGGRNVTYETTQIVEKAYGLTLHEVLDEVRGAERINNLSGRGTE